MNTSRLVALLAGPRVALVLATWFYTYSIHYAHFAYLNPVWDYFGFTYRTPGASEFALIALLVTPPSLLMPSTLRRVSSLVVLLLFVVVYVPAVMISLALEADRIGRYGPNLLALGLAFMIVCLGARLRLGPTSREPQVPDAVFSGLMFACWAIACAVLVYNYAAVMAFVGFDEVYEQRAAGVSTDLAMGYLQTYFSLVFSPALIAIGLVTSRRGLAAAGAVGCLVAYMISAHRTVIMLPFAIGGLYLLLRSRVTMLRTTAFPVLALAVSVALCAAFYAESAAMGTLSRFLVFRTLAIPGLTFSQYYDVFGADGFTLWGHVKGIGLLVHPSPGLAHDPSWPGLGYMIGDRVYGDVRHNVNANLFSGDGVAAAGAIGVVAIGMVLAAWLALLDWATQGWDRDFAMLALLPVALALTNGHFFTTMLSFGGFFWVAVFLLHKPQSAASIRPPGRASQQTP